MSAGLASLPLLYEPKVSTAPCAFMDFTLRAFQVPSRARAQSEVHKGTRSSGDFRLVE